MKSALGKIRIPDEIASLVRNMHPLLKKKIRAALEAIREEPSSGKTLREELEGLKSYRIGTFRIIYRMAEKSIVEIVAVGPRKNIYRETFRIISRERRN